MEDPDATRYGDGSQVPTTVALSPSVDGVRQELSSREAVRSWDVVRTLLKAHHEYGRYKGKAFAALPGPEKGEERPFGQWLRQVLDILEPQVKTLHGRLLLLGLSRLDADLRQYLEKDGFLEAVTKEIREQPIDSLFLAPTPASTTPVPEPDPAPLHVDYPSVEDRLGRRGFVRALALRLDRTWAQYSQSAPRGSFVLHLHGPWGAGKTSLLTLLREELQSRPLASPSRSSPATGLPNAPWIVVDFNAWQHQRLDPPWWPLLDAVYRQSLEQLRGRRGTRTRAARILLRENLWRFLTGRRDVITVAALLLLTASVAYWPLRSLVPPQMPAPDRTKDILGAVGSAFAILGTILSAALLAGRSLLPGSARAAQEFLRATADPMARVTRHFQHLLSSINGPVIVFIDDLDRCRSDFVVHLLEGIQTLFNDPRVMYLIAADRRWLHACFEKEYDAFATSVNEPGRRLGSLFLEKAFELSISLPRVSPEVRAAYWRFLALGEAPGGRERLLNAEREARAEFADAYTDAEVHAKLGSDQSDDPVRQQARREAAVERLAAAHLEESTEFFLQPFEPLLEPNPRSMKRLINAYAIHRDLAILSGLNVLDDLKRRKQLALWTILCLRWPVLEEYLLQRVTEGTAEQTAVVKALLQTKSVRDVLSGTAVGVSLDLEAVQRFAELRGSEAAAGAVA